MSTLISREKQETKIAIELAKQKAIEQGSIKIGEERLLKQLLASGIDKSKLAEMLGLTLARWELLLQQ